jgi:glycosyltransferase involved in cell wall biosynthesis
MRIAMVSEHASPLAVLTGLGGQDAGGQNVHVAALAGALADRGHEVAVYTRRDRPDLDPVVPLRPGVDVVHVPAGPSVPLPKDDLFPHMRAFGAWLAGCWRPHPPDVVHAHFWMSGTAALRARRRVPVPVVHTFHALGAVKRRHQGAADPSPRARLRIEARIAAEADAIVATCTDEIRELIGLGAAPRRLHVVPCGVDLATFRPDPPIGAGLPSRLPPRSARNRLVCLGRLVERKGVDTVIEALAAVPDAELLVAGGPDADDLGSDPDCRRLRATATRCGVADRVRLVGRVGRAEAAELIASADLLVSVPAYEPFGIVPLEAMAGGVPAVVSAVGGMLDTVVDGVTGVHVPPGDPATLATTLRTLLADPAHRRAMGRRGAERAVARYGWDVVARRTEDVYALVLGRLPDVPSDSAEAGTARTGPMRGSATR